MVRRLDNRNSATYGTQDFLQVPESKDSPESVKHGWVISVRGTSVPIDHRPRNLSTDSPISAHRT